MGVSSPLWWAKTIGTLEREAVPGSHSPVYERRHVGNVCAVTREILRCIVIQ